MNGMRVRCRLFARYAELVGRDEVVLELPPDAVVADAVAAVRASVPRAALIPARPLVAVNMRQVLPGEHLHDGDELAFLPPLAGG